MDRERFDALTRRFAVDPAPSRRGMLRRLVGGALVVLLGSPEVGVAGQAEAGRKRGNGRCSGLAKACKRDAQCCSGRCRKKKCRRARSAPPSPFQGTCPAGADSCGGGGNVLCAVPGSQSLCGCLQTTAGATFCADFAVDDCTGCASDADCAGGVPGSACVRIGGCGPCAATCKAPCGA